MPLFIFDVLESDAKSYGCDIFHLYTCVMCYCHLCICVHFRRALESQAKRCLHILTTSGCTDSPLREFTTNMEQSMAMELVVLTGFVFDRMERVANVVDF